LPLLLLHRVDQLEELGAIYDLYEGSAGAFVADYVEGRGVVEADGVAYGTVGFDLGGQFALRIDDEGDIDFVGGTEFRGEVMERGLRSDFELVLKDRVAELVAEGLRMSVEKAGEDRSVVSPLVLGQRVVVADDRDLVGLGGFFDQRGGAGAVGALEVFEDHDGDVGAFGGFEDGFLVLGESEGGQEQEG